MNRLFVIFLILLAITAGARATIDLSDAQIVSFSSETRVDKYVQILQEEVEKRSGIVLSVVQSPPSSRPAILLALKNEISRLPQSLRARLSSLPETKAEGFKLITAETPEGIAAIIGHDQRGLLYGIGWLLRKAALRPGQFLVPANVRLSSSPKYPLRGHQLGYRPKTNAYDAWTVEMFDQYIRELALFGANSIEIMPPRTDDDRTSVHMKLPALQMMAEQSRICNDYGLDVWMWYPNMGSNYTNPDSLANELQERHAVFSAAPRLDHLFVPGGDPGDLEPDVLFSWLEKVADVLHTYHPQAKIWVSPQVFRPTRIWFDAFFQHVNKGYEWFGGVVFGPWVKMPIQEIRRIVNLDIPIRRYPDITHSLSSQYPVPKWDLAYAITLGRECINPRPVQEKAIHNRLDEYAIGSLSYSEGTNDDVNKFVWTGQDWDPSTPVIETLRDYARFFISPDHAEEIAQGMLALEKNSDGPLLTNDGVQRTWKQWQKLEKEVPSEVLSNFRFQMGLIRANFDAYTQRRLIYETELEQQARDILAQAPIIGANTAIDSARTILRKAEIQPVRAWQRQKCLDLADSLFASIGAQLTVAKHHAMSGRGNFIDNIDTPLNDSVWLLSMFAYADGRATEREKLAIIHSILHRTDPGPGGFYDNFGSPGSWSRVKSDKSWEEDPGNLASPRVSFGVGLVGEEWVHEISARGFEGNAVPLAWMHQVSTLYDTPLEIIYNDLDPQKAYSLRIAYTGRFRAKMKLIADGKFVLHDFLKTGEKPIYEFDVPQQATGDGRLELMWTCGEGERGSQVSEIWLIPKK